ncbi:MAG: cysteine desulfurase [Flavobacteriales bacterium]|nr:cysteine desulfurase [Flavobacteriales bacterium]
MKRIYLDNAASTPIAPEVISIMHKMMIEDFGNPSSIHSYGRTAKNIVENSRKKIADLLNTSPGSIFFTSGGTEADNMAINCAIEDYNITHAITSKISHHAVLYPLQNLANKKKIKLSYVKIDKNGLVSNDHLEELLNKNPRSFVSIMHANNEIGTIQNISRINEICKKHNAILHSDTVQTIGHYPFDLQKFDIDFLAASAHKFHGPKGIGFIYISENINISPFLRGGGQERNMRPGTENIYAIAGMCKALELAYENLTKDTKYIKELKSHMINKLRTEIPGVNFYGNCANIDNSLYTVLSVSFPEHSASEMLLFNLDILGISCSGGSACASGSTKGSHVLSIIDPDSRRSGIRFSFSKYNTIDEIDFTINKLKEIFIS